MLEQFETTLKRNFNNIEISVKLHEQKKTCQHNMIPNGRDSHYDYFICKHCGATECI